MIERIEEIIARTASAPELQGVLESLRSGARTLHVHDASGSLASFLALHLFRGLGKTVLVLTPTEDEAAYMLSDLETAEGETPLLRFPATGARPYDLEQVPEPATLVLRSDTLHRLSQGEAAIVAASAGAIAEKAPPREVVQEAVLQLVPGQDRDPEALIAEIMALGFERVEFVQMPGDLAVRGGIVDVYPFTGALPLRIEFFGDVIDSVREFDPKTQRSTARLASARIVPNIGRAAAGDAAAPVAALDFLPPDAIVLVKDAPLVAERLEALGRQAHEVYAHLAPEVQAAQLPPERLYVQPGEVEALLSNRQTVACGTLFRKEPHAAHTLGGRAQPPFNSAIGLLRNQLLENRVRGVESVILCDSLGQSRRLHDLLQSEDGDLPCTLLVETLHEGFEAPRLRLAVYTDHQIFNRYHRPTSRRRRRAAGGLSLREVQNLNPGDFVVHIDYGIGKFAGMERIVVRGKHQDAVRVLFAENDLLYVNVNALYKLQKYSGKEGHQPKLTKLGTGQWERSKARAKKRVKELARDLIHLYAARKQARGHAFPPDSVWQQEMEAAFQYEDTPDQAAAAEAVKEDMRQQAPMDRLVCGDVGFGKTEIAVRAAFKAVQDGKQVAVLVPTTILAEQHQQTFARRLAGYPVRIEAISRFKSAKEQKAIIERLERGELDILIGTHRLVSKDVRFKNLGLLIIDEEQRFGVASKERLRHLRAEVDTLTLTATPIPRTLQFSLLGARDLSIISTPPPNRQPIQTEIHTFDKALIRDAILYETTRGGQVFFIHNRVHDIERMADTLQALLPETRFRTAHGQMQGRQLEAVMADFIDHKFDVLVSTNIIESGLDISNANTIIINNADHFGLSELHQLRGRVGRSDRKAFCYLLVPSIHTLTPEARQRLQAVEEFSDLGSGFNIAMRDMDIRGAGNMLGAEQSGFIEEIGFETYHKILDEAVTELRTEEFAELFEKPVPAGPETSIDVELDAFIPETYIANNIEKLNVYRRISETASPAALEELRAELTDRFGPLPEQVETLLCAAGMRLDAAALRLPRVAFKNERLFLDLPGASDDAYFYDTLFQPLLAALGDLPHRYVLKETPSRLKIIVQDVRSLSAAGDLLQGLHARLLGAAAPAAYASV